MSEVKIINIQDIANHPRNSLSARDYIDQAVNICDSEEEIAETREEDC